MGSSKNTKPGQETLLEILENPFKPKKRFGIFYLMFDLSGKHWNVFPMGAVVSPSLQIFKT